MKLLVENIGQKRLTDTGSGNDFLDMPPKIQLTKRKQITELDENFKYLYIKRHYLQSKKATHRMRENVCTSFM